MTFHGQCLQEGLCFPLVTGESRYNSNICPLSLKNVTVSIVIPPEAKRTSRRCSPGHSVGSVCEPFILKIATVKWDRSHHFLEVKRDTNHNTVDILIDLMDPDGLYE